MSSCLSKFLEGKTDADPMLLMLLLFLLASRVVEAVLGKIQSLVL